MTQALAHLGVRGARGGMATGRVGKLAGRCKELGDDWLICEGIGVAKGIWSFESPYDWQLVELRQRVNPAKMANKRMSCCYSKSSRSSSPNSVYEKEVNE